MYNSAHAILIGAQVSVGMKAGHGQAKACHWTLTPHVLSALNTCHTSETKFNAAFIFFIEMVCARSIVIAPEKGLSAGEPAGWPAHPRGGAAKFRQGVLGLSAKSKSPPRGARSQRQGTAKYGGMSVLFLCRRRRHRHPDQTENPPFLMT